jgi:Kef-type K+ transport system membrane component KefB
VQSLQTSETFAVLAELGAILLLFEVGLESTPKEMVAVGLPATRVALVGILVPMALGYGASQLVHPAESWMAHAFVGAMLAATSVGITARVLQEAKATRTASARIILGAAVIDDVLGLVVLAIISGVIQSATGGAPLDAAGIALIVGKAFGFLVAAIAFGSLVSPLLFRRALALNTTGVVMALSLGLCFGLAWLAAAAGLAPIVGAFAAGLVLEDVHYQALRERDAEKRDLHHLLQPISSFLVPVFFVLMGMGVDLSVFAQPGVLGFAGALTVAAVLGKQVCSLGAVGPGVDRLAVGLGMIPRGEVGLIFASIGRTLTIGGERVVDDMGYSAVVVMVAVTTLVTPPLLVWRMKQPRK